MCSTNHPIRPCFRSRSCRLRDHHCGLSTGDAWVHQVHPGRRNPRRWTNRYAKLLRNASSDKVQENLSLKVDALEQELARWLDLLDFGCAEKRFFITFACFACSACLPHVLFLHFCEHHQTHQDTLTNIAKTSLSSKFIGSESAVFCQIIVDAVKAVKVWKRLFSANPGVTYLKRNILKSWESFGVWNFWNLNSEIFLVILVLHTFAGCFSWIKLLELPKSGPFTMAAANPADGEPPGKGQVPCESDQCLEISWAEQPWVYADP